jgi:hypothetical protein
MPRFYFRFCDGDELPDLLGIEMPDVQTARMEAVRGIRSLVADLALQGRIPISNRVEVENEGGEALLTVTFDEAVKLE